MKNHIIAETARIGQNVKIGYFTVIDQDVEIGDNVVIGNNVTVHPGTKIASGVVVGDNSVLGKIPRPAKTSTVKFTDTLPPLTVGVGAIIGTAAVVYSGSEIGSNTLIADMASVRENCSVGSFVIVGSKVTIENHVTIGNYTKIQTGAYITAYTEIADDVFIAPMVTTTNDNFMGRTKERFEYIRGAVIRKGARIGGGTIILPGITIAEESFVAAGSLVTRDTKERKVYMGTPAKEVRPVPEKELLLNND